MNLNLIIFALFYLCYDIKSKTTDLWGDNFKCSRSIYLKELK